MSKIIYEEFRDTVGDHNWRVRRKGRILARTSEGYRRKARMRATRVPTVIALVGAMSPEELELVRIHLDGMEVDASIGEDLG